MTSTLILKFSSRLHYSVLLLWKQEIIIRYCLKLHFYCFVLHSKSPKPPKPKGKEKRVWDMGGRNTGELDYSGTNGNNSNDAQNQDYEASAEPVSSPALMPGYTSFSVFRSVVSTQLSKYTRLRMSADGRVRQCSWFSILVVSCVIDRTFAQQDRNRIVADPPLDAKSWASKCLIYRVV